MHIIVSRIVQTLGIVCNGQWYGMILKMKHPKKKKKKKYVENKMSYLFVFPLPSSIFFLPPQKQLVHNKFSKLFLLNLVSSGLIMCSINSSVEPKLDDDSFVTVIQWFVVMNGNMKSDVNWLKLQKLCIMVFYYAKIISKEGFSLTNLTNIWTNITFIDNWSLLS